MPVYLQYYFWLVSISLFCLVLERLAPWRREQKMLRRGLGQDVFWLVFNGHYLGLIFALIAGRSILLLNSALYELGLFLSVSVTSSKVWHVVSEVRPGCGITSNSRSP